MSNSLFLFIPVLIPFLLFIVVWILLLSIRRQYRKKDSGLPFANSFLRAPGQSLIEELDELNGRITDYMVCVLFLPTALYAIYISYLFVNKGKPAPSELAVVAGIITVVIVFCLYNIAGMMKRHRLTRLGYDGEVAVGQEPNQLLRDGYHVYHDFPADQGNIDHIVVGRKGIFAVETKVRPTPANSQRQKDATVEYNGTALIFPKHTDSQILEQAERQEKWLSEWISSAIGEDVAARAIVALPGWFVKRTSPEGISVVNPRQFTSFFEHIGPRELTDEMIEQIAHQLEQRCRNGDPESAIYEEDKN